MSREFWNSSRDWSDCHSDERTRYIFTERFSPRPSSRSSYYDPAVQSYGDHRLNSSPKSYHGHQYFSTSRNNIRSHTEERHHHENLSYQGQEPSCYSSNNVWERSTEESHNPENWSVNSRNCYSRLEAPAFEPESWRSQYQEHSYKEFPPFRQLESRLTPSAIEQPYTTQSRPYPFNNSRPRSRNNRSRRLSDRDSSVKDPIRERRHSSRDLSQRESSFHRERSSRRPQDRELAQQKPVLHASHQDWHSRKVLSRQLHKNLPLHLKSSRELTHRDPPLYREPSYRELLQEEQSLHRKPSFRDLTPRDTRDQSQRDTYLYREPQQVEPPLHREPLFRDPSHIDPPLHREPLFRDPSHIDPPLHREPLFRDPPHIDPPRHREPLFRELPYMDPPLQREPSSNKLSYDPSFIENFSVSTRDYSGTSEEQQQEDSEHEGVTTEFYNDDFQTVNSHNMSWRAHDSSEDFFDEKNPNLLPYTQCYRNDLTEPAEPSVFARLDHHSPVIMERASVLTRLGCPNQSSPPRNYSGSPSLPDLRDELVAWHSVSSGGGHNMQTDSVPNVSSHHVSLRHTDSLSSKDLNDDFVIMSPELTTEYSLDDTLSSDHTSHHLPFRSLSSLENIPQECYIKEEENGILPVQPLFTPPISSVTPPHYFPSSPPPPIDSPVTPSLIIDTSLTPPIPVSSLNALTIVYSAEIPFPVTNSLSSVVRTSITTPAPLDTLTTLTSLVSSHVNTSDGTPFIMTPTTIPPAVTAAISPLIEVVPPPILDTPVDAPSLVKDPTIVSFHGNSTSSLPETEAIVPPPLIDSPSDTLIDISSLTSSPAVIHPLVDVPTSSVVTPAVLPLVDTSTTVPFLLDTSTNTPPFVDTSTTISPLVDSATTISPLVDTSIAVFPLMDTSTTVSPLVDTSTTTPSHIPITSSNTLTFTHLSTMNKNTKLLSNDSALVANEASNSNNVDQSCTGSLSTSTTTRLDLPYNINAGTNIMNSGVDLTVTTFTTDVSPTHMSTNTTGANSSVVYSSSTYTNETNSVDKTKLCPLTVDVVFTEKDQVSCSKNVSDSLSAQPTTSDSVVQVSTSISNIPSNTSIEASVEQLEQITNDSEVLEPGEIISDEEEGELTPTPPPSPSNSPKHVTQSTMFHSYRNYVNTLPSFSTTRKQSYRPTYFSRNNRIKNWFHHPRRSHHYRKFPALQNKRKRRERHRSVSDTEEEELELLELRRKALLTMVDRRSNNQQQEKEKQEQVVVVSEDTCNTIASEMKEICDESPGKHLSTESQPIDVRTSDSCVSVVKVAKDEKISEPLKVVSSLNGKLGSGQHSSVKVVTSLNNTWNVKDFRIVTSDLESDDGEKDDIILPTNVDQMIDVCRKVAESKATVEEIQSRESLMKLYQSKLSSLTIELTECENESKTVNTMILSLSKQLKSAKHKLQLCEDRKSLMEQEISKVKAQLALEQDKRSCVDSVDNVSDSQPMIVVEPVSDVDERKETMSGTVNLQFEDVSQPSSVKDSPVLSPVEIELVSDYDHGNESGLDQVMVSKPSSPFSSSTSSKVGHKSTNEKQQLLQIVTAKTQQLAQVKQNYLAILKKKATLRKKHVSGNKRSFVNVKAKNKGSPKSLYLKSKTSRIQSKTNTAYPLVDPLPSQSVSSSSKPLGSTSYNDQLSSKANTNLVKSTDNSEQLHLDIVQVLDSLGASSLNKELVIDNIKKWQPTRECQSSVLPALIISPLNITTEKCFQSFDPPLFLPKLPQEHLHPWLNVDIAHTTDNNLSKSHFTDYQSPLLVFKSYRLNPLYRTLLKRPLASLTHSHSVDPHNPLCHFEIQGKCHNPSCTGQHWDNICLSTEDIVKDLLSYSDQTQNLESHLRSKMSDNEWLVYTAHDVYQNLGHKRSLISASEYWLDSTKNKVLLQKRQPANGQDLIPMPLVSAFQFQPSPKQELDKFDARYFKTTDKEVETCTPDSILKQVSEQDHQENQERALNLLKKGVDLFPDNEILWVEYLRHNGSISNEDRKLLFSKAIACLPSYAVFYEIISLSQTVEEKKQWIMSAYQYESLCEQPMTKHTSHHLLELVLSYVQLEYLQGHSNTMLSIIFSDQQKDSIFKGLPALLSIEDCVFLGLCHLYFLVTHSLPFQVIGCHRNHVPVRLGNKESFFIPWSKDRMNEDEIDVFMNVFKTTLKSCTLKDNSIEDSVRVCLPLYLNLFLFEISQGRETVASQSLNRLVEVAPSILELKLFQLTLAARGCHRREEVFQVENWMTQPNQEPLLYYAAARIELRQASEDAGDRAIKWLVQCVHSYYTISEDTPVDPGLLYRKLLGQYVPYNSTIPPFADGVHSSLENQLVPLWLCYCLLTELTTPPHLETVEDLFEVAIHSIHPERKGYGQLWLDYLVFLACKATSVKSIKHFFDVVLRSLSAIPSSCVNTYSGKDYVYQDWTYHDNVIQLIESCITHTEDMLKVFTYLLQQDRVCDPVLMLRYLECCLKCDDVRNVDVLVTTASYASSHPCSLQHWLLVIANETKLLHYRQARWFYHQITQSNPLNVHLWNQFLMFELTGLVHGYSNLSLVQVVISQCNQHNADLMMTLQVLSNGSEKNR